MSGFVYIWFDRHRKRFYIGSHWGTEDDGYVASNVPLVRAYKTRPQDFKRRILFVSDDRTFLYEREQYYLNMIKQSEILTYENRKNKTCRYYNMKLAARGIDSETSKRVNRERIEKGTHHFLGGEFQKRLIKEGKVNPSAIQKKRVENGNHHWLGGKLQRARGIKDWNEGKCNIQKDVECPHCKQNGPLGPMSRYHFDNCFKIKDAYKYKHRGTYSHGNKWRSKITIIGKTIHLGCFDTQEEAHKAFLQARFVDYDKYKQEILGGKNESLG